MKLKQRIVTFFFFLVVTVPACVDAASFVAYTSVEPVAAIMRRIGGDSWEVHSIVEAGKDPHTFTLTPRMAAELSGASLYLSVGIEMDPMVVVRLPESVHVMEVPDVDGDDHDTDEAHGHDPHLWLDPDGLIAMAKVVSAAFSGIDPDNSGEYVEALGKFEADVLEADVRARKSLSSYRNHRFYVQHDAFTRFAEHYHLQQVAVEEHEKEPTGVRLAEVTRLMMADGSKVIFAQPGHNQRPLEVIAKPVGAEIEILDPMLPDPVEGLVVHADALVASFKKAIESKEVR